MGIPKKKLDGYRLMDTDPSVKAYELGDSGSNWIARIPHVSRLWGALLVAEFLAILVVVNMCACVCGVWCVYVMFSEWLVEETCA